MNPTPDNPLPSGAVPEPSCLPASLDETLRLLANVPVPSGLNERVHAAVMEAALPKAARLRARILPWPAATDPGAVRAGSGWMRAAAAAAIVFVVAGGGWGVYQRVERPTAKVVLMPVAQPTAGGGFSSAGAMRTPQTVKGPVVAHRSAKAGKVKARKHPSTVQGVSAPAQGMGSTAQTVSAPAAAVGK